MGQCCLSKQKTAYEILASLEYRRVLFRSVLGEWLRENGSGGQVPPVSVANGRPQVGRGPAPGTTAARQSLYSRTSLGAQLNGSSESLGNYFPRLPRTAPARPTPAGPGFPRARAKVKRVQ